MAQGNRRFRLKTGVHRLEQWAATASTADKELVYRILFAITDGSVFWRHQVVRDAKRRQEYLVHVHSGLALKISFSPFDTFGIIYIGPHSDVPGMAVDNDAA